MFMASLCTPLSQLPFSTVDFVLRVFGTVSLTLILAAIGWGIGVSMALVMQTSILANAIGPGDLPAPACPEVSLFHIHGSQKFAPPFHIS